MSDSCLISDGILDGLGGGESAITCCSSSPPKCLLSAHGLSDGSLVTRLMHLLFRPTVIVLGDSDILLQELRGKECVENFSPAVRASVPADRVIIGDWMTPSALLHFSWQARFTSEGVRDWERCFFEGRRGGASLPIRVGLHEGGLCWVEYL